MSQNCVSSRKSPVGIIRTTKWDKKQKTYIHTQHGRISGCEFSQLKLLQKAFREEVIPTDSPDAFKILESREYGASQTILKLAKALDLPKILYSRPEAWVDCVMAMIVGRIVYQCSKLSLCNRWQNTALWALCGVDEKPVVEQHCYAPMDRLLERQKSIQKKLAKKHLSNGSLLLYDITSSYFEGEYNASEWVTYGYNRDGKKGHEQVAAEQQLDGCYIIRTDADKQIAADEVVAAYKALGNVERAFRNLKTVQLEMRPMYHKTDDRIRAHIFICMLCYYVQWHMTQRLQPLFENDGTGADREYSFEIILETLRQQTQNTVSCQELTFKQNTMPPERQQTIMDLLAQPI